MILLFMLLLSGTQAEWLLAMNLNPNDSHIMHYCKYWHQNAALGSTITALTQDFIDKDVRNMPANFIAIVRHKGGMPDAVKVWEFNEKGKSLLERFQMMNPGRVIASNGGHIFHKLITPNVADNGIRYSSRKTAYDPLFDRNGDIALNWRYFDNGCRITLTGNYLSPEIVDDDKTLGLGNHFGVNPITCKEERTRYSSEASTTVPYVVQGGDHGQDSQFKEVFPFGSYAIYISLHDSYVALKEKSRLRLVLSGRNLYSYNS